jgi:hypothetical protein
MSQKIPHGQILITSSIVAAVTTLGVFALSVLAKRGQKRDSDHNKETSR